MKGRKEEREGEVGFYTYGNDAWASVASENHQSPELEALSGSKLSETKGRGDGWLVSV